MVYYVVLDTVGNKIMQKHAISVEIKLSDEKCIFVTKEIYDQLTRLPADFETDAEGNIISVTPAPKPEPILQPPPEPPLTEIQEQQLAQAEAIAAIFERLEGGV